MKGFIVEFKYLLVKGFVKLTALMPLSVLYLIGDIAYLILYRICRYRLHVVRKNLHMVFKDKSVTELRKIERDFYHRLTDVFVETLKLAHISDREIEKRVRVEGIELVNGAVAQGKPVVLMLGHFGNWEWVTASARKMDRNAVICEIYHKLRDKSFDRLMLELRSRFDTVNIPMSKSVRRLLSICREGGSFVCGFIADQRPFSRDLKHWTDFCGLDTAYVNGGEVIGRKVGAEFLYAEMMPVKRGYYTLKFSRLEPVMDGEENPYTRAFLKKLETSIMTNPPCWLWSHNRWKANMSNKRQTTKILCKR